MVVQCTSCQARFRIADDKVTERGVRVRCTSCKNVFQVKKPGGSTTAPAPGPGSTMELSALDAAALTRPAPRNQALGAGRAVAAAGRGTAPAPAASAHAAAGSNGARRLQADDLFGMAELTGDSSLGIEPAIPPQPRAPTPRAVPAPAARLAAAAKRIPSFDDIDLEVDDVPPPPRPAPARPQAAAKRLQPAAARRPQPMAPAVRLPPVADPPPAESDPFALAIAATPSPPPPPDDLFEDSTTGAAPPDEPSGDDPSPVRLGGFKTQLKDPFEGLNLGIEGTGAIELSTAAAAPKKGKPAAEKPPPLPQEAVPEEPQLPYSASRELVSSALTGLVGAALAIAVVIGAAFSDDTGNGWLGLGGGSDIVATRVVSGLYDTVSGRPVFYVRGRVENRSKRMRGPVRVIAELVADSGTDAHAESIAGSEPTPEDVFGLRTSAEAEKLNRSLELSDVERRVAPGATLPFFAVITDPPADLARHKLHVRLEPVDAWVPPAPGKGGRGR